MLIETVQRKWYRVIWKRNKKKQNKNNISFTSTLLSWQKQYLIVRVIILCYSTVRVWLCDTLLGVSTSFFKCMFCATGGLSVHLKACRGEQISSRVHVYNQRSAHKNSLGLGWITLGVVAFTVSGYKFVKASPQHSP